MRVAIGSDHAGFELKEAVKAFLVAENREVVDTFNNLTSNIQGPAGTPSRARHHSLRQRRRRVDGCQ